MFNNVAERFENDEMGYIADQYYSDNCEEIQWRAWVSEHPECFDENCKKNKDGFCFPDLGHNCPEY